MKTFLKGLLVTISFAVLAVEKEEKNLPPLQQTTPPSECAKETVKTFHWWHQKELQGKNKVTTPTGTKIQRIEQSPELIKFVTKFVYVSQRAESLTKEAKQGFIRRIIEKIKNYFPPKQLEIPIDNDTVCILYTKYDHGNVKRCIKLITHVSKTCEEEIKKTILLSKK